MDETFTRLVHILSGKVEAFPVMRMPIYLAVSHTWADNLFAPGSPFSETAGRKAIECLVSNGAEYEKTAYCWIDTLCIDQNDLADKQRQIPLMGQIYGNAEVVAIVTKELFGLSQEQIDSATKEVHGAVQMSINGSWMEHKQQWAASKKGRRRLQRAMDCLEPFTRPEWGSRVWTMQEFILAKRTIWIGGDLEPLKVDERLFQAIPDVCDHLSIEECITSKYSKLYSHFGGMAGARLKQIEPTRVMELLGNRTATVPEDEIFGLMAASGVVLDEESTGVIGKEKVWALWWAKAILTGHFRWAVLPPANPPNLVPTSVFRNCIMPAFSVRHLASSNSVLDVVEPYGPVEVKAGTVSMVGRVAGRCDIVRKLGRIYLDQDGNVVRDVTLTLFASKNWSRALRIASAFGAGRYSPRQRIVIAQVLVLNYYRAKLAVLQQKTKSFRPRFRNQLQATVWSDFMLLQSIHMRVMNEGLAFLATISNNLKTTDVVVVTDGGAPLGNLWALDFGAVNDSEKTMFTIVRAQRGGAVQDMVDPPTRSVSPAFHREGVSMYTQVTENLGAALKYSSHILDQEQTFHRFNVGGEQCPVCLHTPEIDRFTDKQQLRKDAIGEPKASSTLKHETRLQMRRQNRDLKMRWKKRVKRGSRSAVMLIRK